MVLITIVTGIYKPWFPVDVRSSQSPDRALRTGCFPRSTPSTAGLSRKHRPHAAIAMAMGFLASGRTWFRWIYIYTYILCIYTYIYILYIYIYKNSDATIDDTASNQICVIVVLLGTVILNAGIIGSDKWKSLEPILTMGGVLHSAQVTVISISIIDSNTNDKTNNNSNYSCTDNNDTNNQANNHHY